MGSGLTHLPFFPNPPGDPDDLGKDISFPEDRKAAGKLGSDKLAYDLYLNRNELLGCAVRTRDEHAITLGRPQSVVLLVCLAPGTYRFGICLEPGHNLGPGMVVKVRGPRIDARRVVMPTLGQVQVPGQNTLRAAQVRDSLQKGLFEGKIVFLEKEEASVRKDQLSVDDFC